MSLATEDLNANFFGTIDLVVDLDEEKEMRSRDVPLDMSICSHEVSGEMCFVELNLS